ncbi:MAG: maleylpyruvate isomerase N-terminal domain-containing protein [Actinomycetota bacterium]
MQGIRQTYLDTAAAARPVLAHKEVARRWNDPSVLQEFTMRGLAGHLVRAVGSTVAYLDRPEPDGPPIDAVAYYAQAVDTSDVSAPLNVAVRERGEAEAQEGHAALVERFDRLSSELEQRLQDEPPSRKMSVYRDMEILLDEYLITRVVELLVHTDDLASSIGIPTPTPSAGAANVAITNLVSVARRRHGDTAVLRALARRERDNVDALRVI